MSEAVEAPAFTADDIDKVLILRHSYLVTWQGDCMKARYALTDVVSILIRQLRDEGDTASIPRLRAFGIALRDGTYPTKKQIQSVKKYRPRMEAIANSG